MSREKSEMSEATAQSKKARMAKCTDFKAGDRVRLVQSFKWKGAEGTVLATCMPAEKTKLVPRPGSTQVWVRFDDPAIGKQHDIYAYQVKKI
jgi:uncharacterized Zn ribbon protein